MGGQGTPRHFSVRNSSSACEFFLHAYQSLEILHRKYRDIFSVLKNFSPFTPFSLCLLSSWFIHLIMGLFFGLVWLICLILEDAV